VISTQTQWFHVINADEGTAPIAVPTKLMLSFWFLVVKEDTLRNKPISGLGGEVKVVVVHAAEGEKTIAGDSNVNQRSGAIYETICNDAVDGGTTFVILCC